MVKRLSNRTICFAVLLFIGVLLGIFYSYFIQYSGLIYFRHFDEYYTRSIVLTYNLGLLDFSSFFHYLHNAFPDKIIYFRNIPFFLLFGVSKFLFSFSSFVLNFVFLLCLFYLLTRFLSVGRAFLFSLLVLSSSFFLELAGLFYVDLHFFFACSFFFILLFLFKDNQKTYFIPLTISVFLLFLTKNSAYLFVPVVIFFVGVYFLVRNKFNFKRVLSLFTSVFVGYCAYFFLIINQEVLRDLFSGLFYFSDKLINYSLSSFIHQTTSIIWNRGLFNNFNFLDKFGVVWVNVFLYLVVFYFLFKKKHLFWVFLFFVGEVFFIILFNVISEWSELRLILPFYFVYLLLMFYFITEIAKTYFKKKYYIPIIIIILLLFSVNINNLTHKSSIKYVDVNESLALFQLFRFSIDTPSNSLVYFDKLLCGIPGKVWQGDYSAHVIDNFYDKNYSLNLSFFADIEPRFNYKVIALKNLSFVQSGGFILTQNLTQYNLKNYDNKANYSLSNNCRLYLIRKN